MAHEETIFNLMQAVQVASKHDVGRYMAAKGYWKEGVSAVNNSYKALNDLTDLGKLERGDGFYRLPGLSTQYHHHARLLTNLLIDCLIEFDALVFREHSIPQIGLRPDAIILLRKEGKGRCLILEASNHETPEYFRNKVNVWRQWPDATQFLSNLFGYAIPSFEVQQLKGDPNGR